jgi:hypothetical protein
MKGKFGIETVGLLGGNSEPGEFCESQFGVLRGNSESKPWGY